MDPKWLQSSMNKVNFDTQNRLLKSSRVKSPCLTSALSLLCNTENKILRELSGGLLNKTPIFQRQISLCSDEPIPKKFRSEIKLETKEFFKDELHSDDSTCNYDFDWPQLAETKEDEIETSLTDAKNKIKLEQQRAKEDLVNAVSISLIQGVSLKDSSDPFRQEILEKCQMIMEFDPEFILKVALYTRQELNIRTTANLLLAFASVQPKCRCFLKKYFKSSIVLPTDWIAVADQFQLMNDNKQKPGFLPAALRKVLVDKFSDFDQYQLAKYNKTKRKKRNIYHNDPSRTMDGVKSSIQFSLKRMVGLLHIRDPAEYVMGLLGKRYPDNQESFVNSRLPGSWDESRAGKRMKLPVPDTWESWLSRKKNTAATWEFLIDGKMLPYMAMLRNLRNLLIAGISKKHHEIIVNKIKNKNAVIKSRQFPYRFYTALDILQDLQNTMFNEGAPGTTKKVSPGERKKNSNNFAIERKKAILKQKAIMAKKHCSKELFGQYRSALQEAIEIAAFFNIPPIQGRTLIFLDVGDHMKEPALTVKSLGKPMLVSKLAEIMKEMCCSVSERCDICEFHYEKDQFDNEELNLSIEVEKLINLTRYQQKVDTVLFVTNDDKELQLVTEWVQQHRATVNPQLLYVHLAIAGAKPKAVNDNLHPNDVRLVGYTDAILRFLSERNNGNRMDYIDNLDKKYKLQALPRPVFEPITPFTSLAPHFRWQTVKVFISSTFLDMQSERDLLVRHIFPELRRRAKSLCMDVYEVDLRWGLKDTDDISVAQLCLEEVLKCQLFIGVLGERYGSVPDQSRLRLDTPSLECLQSCCPGGASITEMEFYLGALGNQQNNAGKAFFYLRDDQFHQQIPAQCRHLFQEGDGHRKKLLLELKNKVKSSGFEVFDGYPCRWGGVTLDGRPRLVELEQFGQRVLNNVWTALLALRQVGTNEEETESELRLQESLAWKHHESFIGCEKTVTLAMKTIGQMQQGLALLVGKRGSGKTALTAHLYNLVKKRWTNRCIVIPFITAASPSVYNLTKIVNYFIEQFSRVTDVIEAQTKSKDIEKFLNAITKVVEKCGKLILFLDGLDSLPTVEQQIDIADWLSADWPKGVVVVCSCSVNSLLHKRLRNSNSDLVQTIPIGPIALKDRMKLIRSRLGEHSKRLDETLANNQLGKLILKRDSNLPLYLSLACEELRTFGDFEKLSDRVQLLKTTVEGLIEDSIISLEQEFGSAHVSLALSLLAVAPNGLTEEELYTLLGYVKLINAETINDITEVYQNLNIQMPLATYKRLVGAIQALTQASVSTLSLAAAASVMSVVRARYKNSLLAPKKEVQLHRVLVGHLWGECQSCGHWIGGNSKALLALPYHLTCGGCLKELKDVLCDLSYIEARFATGTGSQLLEDYRLAIEVGFSLSRCNEKEKQMVEEFGKFVKNNWKILSAEPLLTVQQAMNDVYVAQASADQLIGTQRKNVMRWENKDECRMKAKMTIDTETSCLCVALSPDGRYVAFGEGTIVQLYDLQTERKSMSLVGHSAVVTCLLFAGLDRLCSGSADGTVSIWNVEQGHRLFVLNKHRRRVSCLCLDSTGRFVISAGWDSGVFVWRLNDGELVSTIDWNKKWSAVNCVTSHPYKSMVVTGSWDGKMRIWCLQTLKRKSLLHGHSSGILALSITACGSFLASSSMDLTMKIWSCDHGYQLASIDRNSPINTLIFHSGTNADKGFFISGTGEGAIQIYSCNFGLLVGDVDSSQKVALTCLAINADSLVAGYEDGNVQLMKCGKGYKVEKRVMAHFAKAIVTCVHWRPVDEGSFIILGMSDGQIHIADKDLIKVKAIDGHRSAVKVLITSTKYLISGDEDGVISIIIRPWINSDFIQHVATIHERNITSLSFRNDFKWIASTGFDQTLKLWKLSSLMTQLNHRVGTVNPDVVVEGCHDGQNTTSCWVENSSSAEKEYIVVTAGSDIRLCAWDASNGQQLWTKNDFNAPLNRLFSTRMLICGFSLDGTIYTWNCAGVTISQVSGHGETIAAVYFNLKEEKYDWYRMVMEEEEDNAPKTKTKQLQEVAEQLINVHVARCNASGQVNIIKPCFNNKAEETALCHRQAVVSVSSGADNQIATCSEDGKVLVWFSNALSGAKSISYPTKHFSEISCINLMKLSNDKVAVVTGDRNGYLMVWVVEDGEWKAVTRNRIHHKSVNGVAVVGSIKTTSYVVTCSDDQRLKFWSFGASADKLSNKISQPSATHQPYKLEFKYAVESNYNAVCLDYLAKSGCLSTGMTDDTLVSYFVEFSSNLERPFTAFSRDYTQVSLPTRNENYKPWIIKLKLISDDKMELIFAFTVISLGELWLSTHKKPTLYEGCAVNFGTTASLRDENTQFPESFVEAYPMSMDVCLVSFSTELATFHQFVGLANGFLLSLNLNFSFSDNVATVFRHNTINLHQGPMRALSFLRMNLHSLMVLTGGDDGVVRESLLNLALGTITKKRHKFFCESSVTCLKTIEKNESEIFIGCGDKLGNMYIISFSH